MKLLNTSHCSPPPSSLSPPQPALFTPHHLPYLHPNPHSSPPPSSLSPPQPALFTRHHLPYLHPNPHSSPPPSSLSPPQPALFTRHHLPYLHPNPHCSPTISIPTRTLHRSLPVSITSGSHLVLFADPLRCHVKYFTPLNSSRLGHVGKIIN